MYDTEIERLWDATELDDDTEIEGFLRRRGGLGRPARRGGRRGVASRPRRRPRRPTGNRRRPPRPRPPRRPGRRPPRIRPPRRRPLGRALRCVCPTHGEEFLRWVQSSLNLALGQAMPITGRPDRPTRDALREFQRREGLIEDGLAGPETEQALMRARSGGSANAAADAPSEAPMPEGSELELAWDAPDTEQESFLGSFWPFGGGLTVVDRTEKSPKKYRGRTRDLSKVYALVLHQMAFSRGSRIDAYDKVKAHYAILPDGTVLQLHPDATLLQASHGLNTGSVAVEFAGNFPDTRGRWWSGDTHGRNMPTAKQIEAGRDLVRHLIKKIGLTHVLAHRQSAKSRANDPGPDIWKGVGQWAVDSLGLSDGGSDFSVGTGQPIPKEWRTWRR